MNKCVGEACARGACALTPPARRGLMAKEDLDTLGFRKAADAKKAAESKKAAEGVPQEERKPGGAGEDRRQGFVAGMRPRKAAPEAQR